MRLSILSFLALCTLAPLGCTSPTPGVCSYNGRDYHAGDTFPSDDGCNSCSCTAEGSVVCTKRACVADGGTGSDGGDLVMCTGATPSFPSFAKNCASVTDCFIALHQINCCGSMKALGLNQAEKERFATDEKLCESQYPGCGCAAAPTVAEDGQFESAGKTIVVECQASQCTTLVK
jgi:hypothetical protein